MRVEEYPWERIGHGDGPYKKLHNHAFVFTPTTTRWCSVTKHRDEGECTSCSGCNHLKLILFCEILDKIPTIISGIKNLRVLKTTKSSFVNFVDDEYRSLPDQEDRIFRFVCK